MKEAKDTHPKWLALLVCCSMGTGQKRQLENDLSYSVFRQRGWLEMVVDLLVMSRAVDLIAWSSWRRYSTPKSTEQRYWLKSRLPSCISSK